MKISVALACWRGTAHLTEQLNSLAGQTRLPDEVVAVDDASGDDTAALLRTFAETAPFEMRVIENPSNLGYAHNFARALEETTGDLVFLCDQDDAWFPEKLERMAGWASANPDKQIFACDAELADGALTPSGVTKRGQIAAAGLPENAFVMGCCLAIRRDYLSLMLPFPEAVRAHDTWLVELADRLDLVLRRDTVLQYYRQHGANASDFFVNTTRRLGPVERVQHTVRSFARRLGNDGGLAHERDGLALQLQWLASRDGEFAALCGPGVVSAGTDGLASRIALLESRLAARRAAAPARPGRVAKLWHDGVYRRSGGVFGALRDMTAWKQDSKT